MADTLPDLWILVTLAAAVFQTGRFMLQKYLATATLSAAGATFSRFLYSAPFILLGLVAYLALSATPLPPLGPGFWAHGVVGGTAQILATVCVVLLFKQRNFAVGITFKKTEVILTVLVGWIILGEGVSATGFAAIALGVVGLFLLSGGQRPRGFTCATCAIARRGWGSRQARFSRCRPCPTAGRRWRCRPICRCCAQA